MLYLCTSDQSPTTHTCRLVYCVQYRSIKSNITTSTGAGIVGGGGGGGELTWLTRSAAD
jgi:hypothetical protein